MTGWDIHPPGVHSIVTAARGRADALHRHERSYATLLEGVLEACGSPLVQQALLQFAAAHQNGFAAMIGRASRVLAGASDATNAYVSGDLRMAGDCQRLATEAPDGAAFPGTWSSR